MASKKSVYASDKVNNNNDIELAVDPRVVSDSKRRFADQILGTRIVKINRMDVEGTYKFVIPAKLDELIDIENSFIYHRLKIVGINDDKTSRLIPKAEINYTTEADGANFTATGGVKVTMNFEG